MALKQVSDTEALGRERGAATFQLATGILAETWLEPLALTASIWLDPLSLKPLTRGGSVAIHKWPLPSRGASTPVPAGEKASGGKGSSPVRFRTYPGSPNAQTQHQSDRWTPVTSGGSSSTCARARIDCPHYRWMGAVVLLALVSAGWYTILPAGGSARMWPRLLFGLAGSGLMLFCAFLPVRKKLLRLPRCAQWPILRSSIWETGHSYLGLLSCLVLHFHADWRMGGPLTSVLLGVLWAVIGTGLVEHFFRRLLVLTKAGKEGKGLLAAQIIATTHAFAQEMHGPLTGTLLTLGGVHAMMALFY